MKTLENKKEKSVKAYKFNYLNSDIDPDKAISEILRIQKVHGKCDEDLILHYAKNKKNPLHDHFTWNVNKAAKKQWLTEARELLRKLMVATEVNGKLVYTRAFINIQRDDEGNLTNNFFNSAESTYLNVGDVLSNTKLRTYAIERAFRELDSFERKYANFSELTSLFEAVHKIKKSLRGSKKVAEVAVLA